MDCGKGVAVVTVDIISSVTVKQHVNGLQAGATHFQHATVSHGLRKLCSFYSQSAAISLIVPVNAVEFSVMS